MFTWDSFDPHLIFTCPLPSPYPSLNVFLVSTMSLSDIFLAFYSTWSLLGFHEAFDSIASTPLALDSCMHPFTNPEPYADLADTLMSTAPDRDRLARRASAGVNRVALASRIARPRNLIIAGTESFGFHDFASVLARCSINNQWYKDLTDQIWLHR